VKHNKKKESKMKKYVYFALGYFTALVTIFVVSCSYAPLQADWNTPGHSEAFPMFVKVVP
tara:strand:- start:1117 stop:1296 length:180 start_codon:yes stop_codon:yes gene_type:complete